jgi:hypothetical protein
MIRDFRIVATTISVLETLIDFFSLISSFLRFDFGLLHLLGDCEKNDDWVITALERYIVEEVAVSHA